MNLTGRWIGETQGIETQAHHWLIIQQGHVLIIYTRWEYEPRLSLLYDQALFQDGSFLIPSELGDFKITVTSTQSFIIPKWGLMRDDERLVPTYDVAFQRKETGAKKVLYGILIGILFSLKTVLQVLGLYERIRDPVTLIS